MKKCTANQIMANIIARIRLLEVMGVPTGHPSRVQLQEILTDICRHNLGIETIENSTTSHKQMMEKF